MARRQVKRILPLVLFCVLTLRVAPAALAQGPNPPPTGSASDPIQKLAIITQLALDLLQGHVTPNADALFEQTKRAAAGALGDSDFFFLDFGNPNLPINQFAIATARTLLLLTPLYALGYLVMLLYNVWREKPIPNPVLYFALVVGVMIFLAAFAVITQGVSELGRALATGIGGAGGALFPRASFLDTITRALILLQKNGGVLSVMALIIASIEFAIIVIQLAYRGISMAIWRLFGILLIPLSVLLEGVQPKTAAKVVSGFFEAWLDMVGKIALLLIVLSLASSENFANSVWFILPAGLLAVVLSWKFFGISFAMVRDAAGRAWNNLMPAYATDASAGLPASAEAARSREIDEERKRLMRD